VAVQYRLGQHHIGEEKKDIAILLFFAIHRNTGIPLEVMTLLSMQGPGHAEPRHRQLVLRTAGKEPGLVWDVERYQLDMVGLTSTHSTGSGTKLLGRAGLSFSGVVQSVRCRASVGILPSPWLTTTVLEFSPVNERVASMPLQVAGGKALTVLMHRAAVQSIWVPSWKGFYPGDYSSTGGSSSGGKSRSGNRKVAG